MRSNTCPPHRILVVDDDLLIRQLSAKALSHSGYRVDAAEDGAAAWEALSGADYDLVITDNDMPKVSGIELLEKLHTARIAVPVILASGQFPTEALHRRPWLRLAASLEKPFEVNKLVETVRAVLRRDFGHCQPDEAVRVV
jgi:DNA-binding response OmpR family regulator